MADERIQEVQNWLTLPEAAERIGISLQTARRWVRSGRLEAELRDGTWGPQYFVSAHDVERAAHERTRSRSSTAGVQARLAEISDAIARQDARFDQRVEDLATRFQELARVHAEMQELHRELVELRRETQRLTRDLAVWRSAAREARARRLTGTAESDTDGRVDDSGTGGR